ncbi:putative transcriptional regulator, TetR family protein [Mycobacteroides chelonae]|uniref:TetR/AcrR family transcriptional regulator n=1 Tax=Mycobacteroides chelonae TaxID=1774 RepID=UPI002231F174|nr:TetR/AcrR family transcriptional regulator [Mycobacteroides chelonae]GLE56946.1 putative transcriptional regulator, TetR family protein [Mycobacteroides chelonae]
MNKQKLEPRKLPRQRRSEDTRKRILEAAVQVFTRHGYIRGTTNRIAECAGISIGSLYQYYPNKDAIVIELAALHLEGSLAATRAHRSAAGFESAESLMRSVVAAAIDNHRHDPEFLRILIEQAPRSDEFMAKVIEVRRVAIDEMHRMLDECPGVNIVNKNAAAQLVVTTVEVVVHHVMAAPDLVEVADFESELVAMLSRYLTSSG